MEQRDKTETKLSPELKKSKKKTESTDKSLPASPAFDIEVIASDPEQEPVSTHNFCQVGPGSS